jgi:purine-binding chemotaxis protein CheW
MARPESEPHDEEGKRSRLIVFHAAGARYALPHYVVQEIIRLPALSQVPLAPSSLLGIANLRGAVLSVVDLSRLLAPADLSRAELHRTTESAGGREIDPTNIQTKDVGLAQSERADIASLVRDDQGSPIRVLDMDALLASAFPSTTRNAVGRVYVNRNHVQQGVAAFGGKTFIAFTVSNQEFALPVADVLEVMPADASQHLASAGPPGDAKQDNLLTFRGSLVPLFALSELLGLEPDTNPGATLIARAGNGQVGLLVRQVNEILRVAPEDLEAFPEIVSGRRTKARIQSVIRREDGHRLISVLSSGQMFGDDAATHIGVAADAASNRPPTPEVATHVFLIVRLGEQEYGLPIASVEEVSRRPEHLTPLPLVPDFLVGVINLRGGVLPVIDQRMRFGVAAETGADNRLVVMRVGGQAAGFIVDAVHEVLRTTDAAIAASPDILAASQPVNGILNLEGGARMILLLDPARLLSTTELALLDTAGRVEEAQQVRDQASGRR